MKIKYFYAKYIFLNYCMFSLYTWPSWNHVQQLDIYSYRNAHVRATVIHSHQSLAAVSHISLFLGAEVLKISSCLTLLCHCASVQVLSFVSAICLFCSTAHHCVCTLGSKQSLVFSHTFLVWSMASSMAQSLQWFLQDLIFKSDWSVECLQLWPSSTQTCLLLDVWEVSKWVRSPPFLHTLVVIRNTHQGPVVFCQKAVKVQFELTK